MRYCRERKDVFDNYRNRRQNFDDVDTEEEIRRPNSARRFTPSPTRGRSPTRRFRSPRQQTFALRENIAISSMGFPYRKGKSDVWVANLQPRKIPLEEYARPSRTAK
ncbi:hypothetical protein TNIN_75291 [Trichonephila inaurata madagascariensis]|uniref:Uncharacterized protein n=1 Tax=Trichonephila inaurata madagascariensis TaxID=2747483 RepID=A0A8X6XAA9_9ARAC|nr:hypothetical protein TNIN_75291 [Trichonephila inaurata madagascariensis]